MSASPLAYAAITPVRNEAENLRRLAESLASQTARPRAWIVVDNGSTDATVAVAEELRRSHPWIRLLSVPGERAVVRGAPIVRAFNAGLDALDQPVDIVVKLDADVSLDPDYFERLLGEFAADPALGIAGGNCYELRDGSWTPTYVTKGHVRGATRAYRWTCLEDVQPLEERMGWDGVDELKASVRGWRTTTFLDLPFYHHRIVGERDGARWRARAAQGRASWYMGYRVSYLLLRALHATRQEPAGVAMVAGFLGAALRREPRLRDEDVRAYLRRHQSVRHLPLRRREALGRRAGS